MGPTAVGQTLCSLAAESAQCISTGLKAVHHDDGDRALTEK